METSRGVDANPSWVSERLVCLSYWDLGVRGSNVACSAVETGTTAPSQAVFVHTVRLCTSGETQTCLPYSDLTQRCRSIKAGPGTGKRSITTSPFHFLLLSSQLPNGTSTTNCSDGGSGGEGCCSESWRCVCVCACVGACVCMSV